MHKTPKTVLRFVAIAGARAVALGLRAATRRTSVAELKYNPAAIYDKTVSIDGVVTSSWGRPAGAVQALQGGRRHRRGNGGGAGRARAEQGGPRAGQGQGQRSGDASAVSRLGLHLRQTDLDFRGR